MKRWLFTLILAMCTVASALAVVTHRHQTRATFDELTGAEKHRDQLMDEWGRLQIEQATFTEAGHLEARARNELELVVPTADQVEAL